MSAFHPTKRESQSNQIKTPVLVESRKKAGTLRIKNLETIKDNDVPGLPTMEEVAEEEMGAVIIDNGSGSIKAGFSTEETPRCVFPTVIAYPRSSFGPNSKIKIGEEAQAKWGIQDVRCPIERGVITNWEDMETIWHHAFFSLRANPKNHPVFLTEVPLNPKANRERMTKIMFKTFHVPCLYINNTAILALYANSRTSGCVLESGQDVTHAVPVYEGYVIPHAIMRLPIGGRDLTTYMEKALEERGNDLQDFQEKSFSNLGLVIDTTSVHLQVNKLKEKLGYVALDFDQEMIKAVDSSSTLERNYKMADGSTITVGNERFYFPEHLFKPDDLLGMEEEGVADLLYQSIMKCEEQVRGHMFSNIVLAGGSTMFPGFKARVEKELVALAGSVEINIKDPPDRAASAWVGGAILASLDQFYDMWITKEEYDEMGPAIVHKKCY